MMDEEPFLRRFQEFKLKVLKATTNSILKSTIQFFSDNKRGEPSATGSGLLITLGGRFFMITAAHVIAEDYNDLFVILPNKELRLGGVLHFTPLPESGKREDDKLDIAVMELDDLVSAELCKSFDFTGIDNIELDHQTEELKSYLSVGYPATKTKKVWKKAELSAEPYPYHTQVETNFDYEKFGFKPTTHLAVKFDGEVTSSNNPVIHKAPKLNGISGSGLWYLKDFATPKTIDNKQLVALVIEQVSKANNQAIIATKIDLITEFIRQHFGLDIPRPKKLKVNTK